MRLSPAGRLLIKQFEACRLDAYRDAVGIPTIGYGHIEDVKMGQKITQHQADVIFDSDAEKFEEGVTKLFPGATQNQFDALTSLAFNVGLTNVANSRLRSFFLAGDLKAAAAQFDRWCHAGGKKLDGLVMRRAKERALFETP